MNNSSGVNKDSFSEKMIRILNLGALNLALAIGYRTGLLDVLDRFETPQTLASISAKAGLNPRYIQEWLAIMVSGEIVELSQTREGENQYYLPGPCGNSLFLIS